MGRGIDLMDSFESTDDLADIFEAISVNQQAVRLTADGNPDMPGRLDTLGLSLRKRFERTGDLSDLSEAILNQQRAVKLASDGHPDILICLTLCGLLRMIFNLSFNLLMCDNQP